MAFYELRKYEIRPGMMESWIRFFDTEIAPFQIARGMVVAGSWRDETDDGVFVWMRRFEDEAARERLYKAVYEDAVWLSEFRDRVGAHIVRETIEVTRLTPTGSSVLQ